MNPKDRVVSPVLWGQENVPTGPSVSVQDGSAVLADPFLPSRPLGEPRSSKLFIQTHPTDTPGPTDTSDLDHLTPIPGRTGRVRAPGGRVSGRDRDPHKSGPVLTPSPIELLTFLKT